MARERVAECRLAVDRPPSNKEIWCQEICSQLLGCQFVIVILDESNWRRRNAQLPAEWAVRERNANVYFEYGLAMGFKKRVVCLLPEGIDPPFDTGSLSVLMYRHDDLDGGVKQASLRGKLLHSIASVYPVMTDAEVATAFDSLFAFYVGAKSKGKPHKVQEHAKGLLKQHGLNAWARAATALRTHPTAQKRITAGITAILSYATKGYNPDQIDDYLRICSLEGSYAYLIGILSRWTSAKQGFTPGDVAGLLSSAAPNPNYVACRSMSQT